MRKILLFLIPIYLHAQIYIEADHFDYNGDEMFLNDNVLLDNGKCQLRANYVTLSSESENYDFIKLDDNVEITFEDQGVLTCQFADIDLKRNIGTFYGEDNTQAVFVFSQKPVKITSNEMVLDLDDELKFKTVLAKKEVKIDFENQFYATSEEAHYQIPNELVLQGSCYVKNDQNDEIYAKKVNYNTEKKNLIFTNSKGILGDIQFQSETLEWHEDIYTLKNQIEITQPNKGTIKTDDLVKIVHKDRIQTITSKGNIEMTFDFIPNSSLKCLGSMFVDNLKQETSLKALNDQIVYRDNQGHIFSDKAHIKYEEMLPETIDLYGNVRLVNQKSNKQYAISDQVSYDPKTREMCLSAKKPNRVLFYDKSNNLQVSAPALKVKRNKLTQKDSIRGIGDVRFNFVDHELEALKKRFLLEENVAKNRS